MRVEKLNRLKLVERDLENLADAKIEAETFLEKEKAKLYKKDKLFQLLEFEASIIVDSNKEKEEELKKVIEKRRNELIEITQVVCEKEHTYSMTRKNHDELQGTLMERKNKFEEFEIRDTKMKENLKHAKQQIKKLQSSISIDQAKKQDSIHDMERFKEEAIEVSNAIQNVESKINEEEESLAVIMNELKDKTEDFRQELEAAQSRLADSERCVSELNMQKDKIDTTLNLLESKRNNISKSYHSYEVKLCSVQQEDSNLKKKLKELSDSKSVLQDENNLLSRGISDSQKKEVELKDELFNALKLVEENKVVDNCYSNVKGNKVYDAIKAAMEKGGELAKAGIRIRGRLGDLASIDGIYDVAISTACSFLDHIVVDDAESGQACVDFLRDHNLGRASFIIVNKMTEWETKMMTNINIPIDCKRLFDIISPVSDDLKPVFYFALRDTLVAQDLESASSASFHRDPSKRHRVVTIDGELVDISGAISGGGKTRRQGAMLLKDAKKSSVDNKENTVNIDTIEERITVIHSLLKELQANKRQIENKMAKNIHDLKNKNHELKRIDAKLLNIHANEIQIVEMMTKLKEDLQNVSENYGNQSRECKDVMLKIDEDIKIASPDLLSRRNQVKAIQQKIADIGGPKVLKAQNRIELLNSQSDKHTEALVNLESKTKMMEKTIDKIQKSIDKNNIELQASMEKQESYTNDQIEMENDALLVMKDIERLQNEVTIAEELLGSCFDDYNNAKANCNQFEEEEKEMNDKLIEYSLIIKEKEALCTDLRNRINEIRNVARTDGLFHIDEDDTLYLGDFSREKLLDMISYTNTESLESEIESDEIEIESLREIVNVQVLIEYAAKNKDCIERRTELEEINSNRHQKRCLLEDLRRDRLQAFMKGFSSISLKLKEMYQMMTLGGDAELELVDSMDPFSEGVVFSVRPPKKSWKNIINLSGGEKTLSSLALVFSLHHYKPTALYVMDEIDAALDFKNVSIVSNYIKERTKNAQFIIISLR